MQCSNNVHVLSNQGTFYPRNIRDFKETQQILHLVHNYLSSKNRVYVLCNQRMLARGNNWQSYYHGNHKMFWQHYPSVAGLRNCEKLCVQSCEDWMHFESSMLTSTSLLTDSTGDEYYGWDSLQLHVPQMSMRQIKKSDVNDYTRAPSIVSSAAGLEYPDCYEGLLQTGDRCILLSAHNPTLDQP